MIRLPLTALGLIWAMGVFSIGCAHAQDNPPPPPPFGQEPPDPPPPPPRGPDQERRAERIENAIHELEMALKSEDTSDDRRAEIKKKIEGLRRELKEMRGGGRPQDPLGKRQDKAAQLEREMHKLELALEGKDGSPEQREEWKRRLHDLRDQMEDLRTGMRNQDPHQDPGFERMHNRIREIDEMLAKGAGPEDRKALMAEREKLQADMGRRQGQQGPGMPGMPPDPELHKLTMEAQELDRASMDLAMKLRRLPAESKDDRAEILSKMKETVTKLFDVREKARAREIEMIKKRLEELTQMLDKRKENRDAIIEKRIKQLSGESDPLDW